MSQPPESTMTFSLTTKKPKLAHIHSKDTDEHVKSLMGDFEAVNVWLQENQDECSNHPMKRLKKNIALGVKQGLDSALEDISQDIRKTVGKKFVKGVIEKEIAKELSKGLSIGLPRLLFDKLHNSYKNLSTKLTAEDEPAGGHNQRLREHVSRTSSALISNKSVSEKVASQDEEQTRWPDDGGMRGWRRVPSEDSEASFEIPEEHNEGSYDRCCVCSTLASEEELIITTCCSKPVGSLCFEEALQETGKCCLCHETQNLFPSPKLTALPEHDLDYKIHFVEVQDEAKNSKKENPAIYVSDTSETGIACPSQKDSQQFMEPGKSAEPEDHVRETSEWTTRTSKVYKPNDKLIQSKGTRSRGTRSSPSTQLGQKSHGSSTHRKAQRLEPLGNDPEGSVVTKEYELVLRLFDQAVISYLKDLSREDVSTTVYEALEGRLPPTVHTTILFGVLLLESGDVRLKYGIDKSQAPDLEGGAASWAETLEKSVRARLGTYTVIMHNLETETMDLSDEVMRTRTIEELVGYNASAMQYLSRPDDIPLIRWTMGGKNIHKVKIGSVTMDLATAAQANEVMIRGLLWKGQRRYCVKHGPRRKLVQCNKCQAFGHTAVDCSSPPRCSACAKGHRSKHCPLGLNASPKGLKCALCGGGHSARDYFCTVRRGEELRLGYHFYPMDAGIVLTATETIETTASLLPASTKTPLLATSLSHLPNTGWYSEVGINTPVVEQRPPSTAFTK